MRTDGVHCRESYGTGPVVLKVVPVTSAGFSGLTMDHFLCVSIFFTLTSGTVDMCHTESIEGDGQGGTNEYTAREGRQIGVPKHASTSF